MCVHKSSRQIFREILKPREVPQPNFKVTVGDTGGDGQG